MITRDGGTELLRVDQVVELLQIGRSHLYRLIRNGELRLIHVGRIARVPRGEVDRFLRRLEAEQWGEATQNDGDHPGGNPVVAEASHGGQASPSG